MNIKNNLLISFKRLFCLQILLMQFPIIIWFGLYLNRMFHENTNLSKNVIGIWEAMFLMIFFIAFLVSFLSTFIYKKSSNKRGDIGAVFLINFIIVTIAYYDILVR